MSIKNIETFAFYCWKSCMCVTLVLLLSMPFANGLSRRPWRWLVRRQAAAMARQAQGMGGAEVGGMKCPDTVKYRGGVKLKKKAVLKPVGCIAYPFRDVLEGRTQLFPVNIVEIICHTVIATAEFVVQPCPALTEIVFGKVRPVNLFVNII